MNGPFSSLSLCPQCLCGEAILVLVLALSPVPVLRGDDGRELLGVEARSAHEKPLDAWGG